MEEKKLKCAAEGTKFFVRKALMSVGGYLSVYKADSDGKNAPANDLPSEVGESLESLHPVCRRLIVVVAEVFESLGQSHRPEHHVIFNHVLYICDLVPLPTAAPQDFESAIAKTKLELNRLIPYLDWIISGEKELPSQVNDFVSEVTERCSDVTMEKIRSESTLSLIHI